METSGDVLGSWTPTDNIEHRAAASVSDVVISSCSASSVAANPGTRYHFSGGVE